MHAAWHLAIDPFGGQCLQYSHQSVSLPAVDFGADSEGTQLMAVKTPASSAHTDGAFTWTELPNLRADAQSVFSSARNLDYQPPL
jgi:hypothetical protein